MLRFNGSTTVACVLDKSGRRPAGFDYLRIVLSLGVVLGHSILVCGQDQAYKALLSDSLWRPVLFFRLPMFFALSGFLICASAERCRTLLSFGLLRGLRIFPALMVEVAISACLLGPIVTDVPIANYFQSDAFKTYFLSGIGWIHYTLPGVFADHPAAGIVNLSLWTLPVELLCYLIMALVLLTRNALAGRTLLVLIALIQLLMLRPFFETGGQDVIGPQLILCFLVGVALYRYRTWVVIHPILGLTALVVSIGLLEVSGGITFVALPISYLTIYLGLQSPKLLAPLKTGDYSYGIYLYSFPIQQTVVTVFGGDNWWLNAAISIPMSILAAVASWHFLEKHIAGHKAFVLDFEQNCLNLWRSFADTARQKEVVPILVEGQPCRRRRLRAPIY